MTSLIPILISNRLRRPRLHAFCLVRAVIALAVILAGISDSVGALGSGGQVVRPDPSYLIDNWTTEDGLPENSATAIVQTPDGYLWFGTFNGLVRFNGTEFTVLNPANTPELPSAGIVNLHLDRRGRLWISTYRGLVVRDGSQWRQLTRIAPDSNEYARTFADRANGDLLITAFHEKLFEFSNGKLAELPTPPGDKGEGYLGGVDEEGHWWAVQRKFIGRLKEGRWVSMIFPPSDSGNATGFGPARDGGMWLVLGNELRKLRRGAEVARVTLSESPGSVWSLSEDSQGNVWIATFDKGVCRVAPDGTMTRWNAANGGSDRGRCVFEDRERNLWIGTSGDGLTRFVPRRFQFFDLQGGRNGQVVQSVWPDATGGLWAGTYGRGLFHLSEAGVTNVPLPDRATGPEYVRSVLRDRTGRLWVGTLSDAVWLLEKNGDRHLPATETGGRNIHALFEDSRGRIWVSGGSGIAVFDEDRSRGFGPEQGLPVSVVTCFAEDASGAVWLSNGDGVFRTDGEHDLVEVRDAIGKPIHSVGCLIADPDGSMWMGSSEQGLLRWKEGKLASLDTQAGFPVSAIQGIVTDGAGFFWMTSGRRVVRARLTDLQAAADGRKTRIECQVFDANDGLPNAEFTSGRQPTCVRDTQGRLWFATTRGVAMVEPAALRLNDTPPPVRVEGILFSSPAPSSKSAVPMRNRGEDILTKLREPFAVPLSLPAGSRRIEIHYAALSLVASDKVQFQFSLDGQDGDWQDAGNRRVAYYHDLSPGDHVFHVRAANNDGVWNETGANLAFTVRPFFWQTTWFRLLAAIGLIGGGAGSVWAVVHGKLRRHQEELAHQRALAESQQRVDLAASAANLGIWERDLVRHEIWASDQWRALFGFEKSERLNFDLILQRIHPDDREHVRQVFVSALHDKAGYEMDYRIVLPDGRERWIASRGRPEFDSAGKPILIRGVSLDITSRKLAEEEARDLSGRLIHAQEDERRRIARDLHDDLSQRLALISVELEMFGQKPPTEREAIAGRMQEFSGTVKSVSSEVHRLAHELHPAKLDQLGLVAAVRGFCKELAAAHEVAIVFEPRDVPRVLSDEVALCLYRVTQEALQNAVKHSDATSAKVELTANERELQLVITDDGHGFDPQAMPAHGSLGIVSMRERVRMVQGQISVQSRPGEGTRIEVRVPIMAPAGGADDVRI